MLWSPTRRWRSPGATSPRKGWSSSRSARSDICCSSRSQSDDDDQRADLFIRPWYGLSRFGIALRHGAGARTGAWELEELAQQTRRYRRYRIVPQYGCVRRTNYFVSNPGQALVAAAKEQSDNRNLPEHVVEAVERNESATHANIAAHIIDVSVNGSADDRPFHETVANDEAPERAGEIDPQMRELHARRGGAGVLRRRHRRHALERCF